MPTLANLSPVAKRSIGGAKAAAAGAANLTWEHLSDGMKVCDATDEQVVCAKQQEGEMYACAVGPRLPSTGVSELSIRILACDGSGGSMLVGLAEDLGAFPPLGGAWGKVYGLAPWNGNLFGFPDGARRDKARRMDEIRGMPLMRGDMRGTATGATIHMRVDMQQRRLYFKATQSDEWTLARDGDAQAVVLHSQAPAKGWRPFVRCARAGDSFALGALIHTEAAPDAPPRPPAAEPSPRVKFGTLPAEGAASRPAPSASSAEIEALRAELAASKEQNDTLRHMLLAEKERRIKAEDAAATSEKRYEREKRLNKRLTQNAAHDPEAEAHQKRVKDIEAALLREAMLHNEKERASIADGASAAITAARVTQAEAQGNAWKATALRANAARDSFASVSTYAGIFS